MKTFKIFLESAEYKAQDGESEIVHHVSPHDFNEFRPLSHFGTKHAARHRAIDMRDNYNTNSDENYKHPMHYYSSRIKLGNVAQIDDESEHHPHEIANSLLSNGHITDEEHKHILSDKEGTKPLLDILKKKNIHSLSYENGHEDAGSASYIITHPDQVRILKKGKIDISNNTVYRVSDHNMNKN